MAAPVVGIVGLKALARDIKQLGEDQYGPLFTAMKKAGKEAAEPVATRARNTVPLRSGKLSKSVRTSATRTGAAVRMGRATVPYAGWIEFGGIRKPQGGTREFIRTGRYLFPAARSLAYDAETIYTRELQKMLDRMGWTNTTNDPGAVHD